MTVRCVIYCRISTDREGLSLGVDRQEDDARALAARKGWEVVDVLVDNDISATSGRRRPGWEQVLAMITDGRADALVAYSSSRMYRSPKDLEPLLELAKTRGTQIATVVSGDLNLSTADGRMLATILVGVDRGESERISERIRRKLEQLARNGEDGGGPRPFGFEADRVTIRESEAVLVRAAAGEVLEGASLNSIAGQWNRTNVISPRGKVGAWTSVRVREILTSPRTAGLRQHKGTVLLDDSGEPVRATWASILDEDTWLQLRAKFRDGNGRKRSKGRQHLLTGLVICTRDNSRMRAQTTWRTQPAAYVCRSCHRRIGADGLEAYVVRDQMRGAVLAAFDRLPQVNAEADREALKQRHTAVAESLSDLARDRYIKRTLPAETFDQMSAELTKEMQSLEAALQPRSVPKADSVWGRIIGGGFDSFEQATEGWTIEDQHRALAEVIAEVRIGQGVAGRRGLDPSRVELVFRSPYNEEE